MNTPSVEGTGLDERDNDGLPQATHSGYPQGSASVSCMQGEPDDNHESEEDVERK